MFPGRFVRDAENATNWDDKFWYPPTGQLGTPWIPATDATDEKLNLEKVEVLFYLFMVQIILAGLWMTGAFLQLCLHKTSISNLGRIISAVAFIISLALFGMSAILYNCLEFLMITTALNIFAIIVACIVTLLSIVGSFAVWTTEESKFSGVDALCTITCTLIMVGLCAALPIAVTAITFPFIQ